MNINKNKVNTLDFKAFIDNWDVDFNCYEDAHHFCSYNQAINPKSKIRIEVRLTEILEWDGEHGKYKDHILATINY